MDNGCIFCKIVKKEIPAEIIFEDEYLMAFKDLRPEAPVHFLIIPKKHIETINGIEKEDSGLMGKIVLKAKDLALDHGLARNGYRLVANCNKDAGQEVFHVHFHLLGGRKFSWPPG